MMKSQSPPVRSVRSSRATSLAQMGPCSGEEVRDDTGGADVVDGACRCDVSGDDVDGDGVLLSRSGRLSGVCGDAPDDGPRKGGSGAEDSASWCVMCIPGGYCGCGIAMGHALDLGYGMGHGIAMGHAYWDALG